MGLGGVSPRRLIFKWCDKVLGAERRSSQGAARHGTARHGQRQRQQQQRKRGAGCQVGGGARMW